MNETLAKKANPEIDLPPVVGEVVVQESKAMTQPSDSAMVLQMVDRMSRDPTVDVIKMRDIVALYKELDEVARNRAFDLAMNEAQTSMEQVRTDAENPQTHSRYASYAALDRAIRPLYIKAGFSISYDTGENAPPEHVRVICHVSRDGVCRTNHVDIPCDGKGAQGGNVMSKTHATVAAVTYGKRVNLGNVFNIAVSRDDDGNSASADNTAINEKQLEQLRKRIVQAGADIPLFCAHMEVDRIEDIPARRFKKAMSALDAKINASKKKGKQK